MYLQAFTRRLLIFEYCPRSEIVVTLHPNSEPKGKGPLQPPPAPPKEGSLTIRMEMNKS